MTSEGSQTPELSIVQPKKFSAMDWKFSIALPIISGLVAYTIVRNKGAMTKAWSVIGGAVVGGIAGVFIDAKIQDKQRDHIADAHAGNP